MSKSHGLGAGFLIGGTDVSGDIGSLGRISSPRSVLDLTDITQSAPERALALKDGAIEFSAWFNPDRAHPVLSALPRTDTGAMYLHRRGVQGAMAACMVAKQVSYDGQRQQDGSFSFGVATVANGYGLEWAEVLSEGIQTFTDEDESASVDDGAASSFGFQAYLQVTDFDGTDVTFAVQSSSDNGGADAFADVTGAVFPALTDVGDARVQTARDASIERYLRVAATGTFTSVTFAVAVVRNPIEVTF